MIQPIGYLRLWREVATKPIWLNSTPEHKTILITLMMMVNFKTKQWEWKGEKFQVEKGQVITSIDTIVKNCGRGVTTQNVRSAIKRFEKLGFLTNESTKTGRLITIANWESYQPLEKNQQSKQPTSNKEVTKSQQRGNKEVTPREEGNKVKNENKDNTKGFDSIRKCFPGTKTLSVAKKKLPQLIKKYSVEELIRSCERYEQSVIEKRKKQPDLNFVMESTFWNGRYMDFLDENYVEEKQTNSKELLGRKGIKVIGL